MRIDARLPTFDLRAMYEEMATGAPMAPELLDQLVRAGPELFSGSALTGAAGVPNQVVPGAGTPLFRSELAPRLLDPRAQADLAARDAQVAQTSALAGGEVDRAKLEAAVKEAFGTLGQRGLPLEARPGSALAEAIASGDFSQLSTAELGELLLLLALYGRNRHKPNGVAQSPRAAMAPRGSWSPSGANRAGGGTNHTGLNRQAEAARGPAPAAGDIPPGTPAGQRLATTARNVANSMNSTGWCYRGVKRAVAEATGVQLSGGSAYQAADQLAGSGKFREVQASPAQLRDLPPGAVVVWGRTDRSPHGHISVALGNGQEASDHVQNQITSLRGATNYRVFVPQD